jgi:hypothetical protein
MYQKLDSLKKNGCFVHTDPVELRRTATALKNYLENELLPKDEWVELPNGTVNLQFGARLLPLCERALSGQIALSLDPNDVPFNQAFVRERLPEKLLRKLKNFSIAVTGLGERLAEPIETNGERYCLREFEEPGDWPNAIREAEDARRRASMGNDYVPVNPGTYE